MPNVLNGHSYVRCDAGQLPADVLSELAHQVPQLLDLVAPASLTSLLATSTSLRKQIQQHTNKISIRSATPDDINHLVRGIWPQLAHLQLPYARMSMSHIAASALAQATQLQLQTLEIRDSRLKPHMLAELLKMCFTALKSLILKGSSLDLISMAYLARADLPVLVTLDLSSSNLNAEAAGQLSMGSWHSLKVLNLSRNKITAIGILRLADAQWPVLEDLFISKVGIRNLNLTKICQGNWSRLQRLDLTGNDW